ncbi:hypothetical protein EJF36_04970 [Bacillus sp. HMF5848]|uniref:hypothetical protein n=1 Tax=Bacillus sp. HMF5848 TaxID=2495421 RepID=UPI000F76DB1B|nr:hypothetical protein [Bacillus sp. HMF5848]RSK26260.1 hypothetical protein EJF36_04970 [Bacillus sp. HMF5848]
MVIQANMSPATIVSVWPETKKVFAEFEIRMTDRTLDKVIANPERLTSILEHLNVAIGSYKASN